MSLQDRIKQLSANEGATFSHDNVLSAAQVEEIAKALMGNTTCTDVTLANCGVDDAGALLFADVIKTNSTITKLDLGYNKIYVDGIVAIGNALSTNSTLVEVKLHRQEKDCGPSAEEALVSLWDTNTTLTRLYATLHSRKFNGDNTRGEVRNKEIGASCSCVFDCGVRVRAFGRVRVWTLRSTLYSARRKEQGKDWMDLDPARRTEYAARQEQKRKEAAEAEALANAPISSKVEATGKPTPNANAPHHSPIKFPLAPGIARRT